MILLDLFSGIGGFHLGLERGGVNISKTYFSEINKHAIANYKYNFKNAEYIGAVESILDRRIERPNIITFGSPCFVKGTQTLTNRGFIDISEVEIGDKVLTHKGRWMDVVDRNEKRHIGNLHSIKLGKDTELIHCTPEHPFYVVKKEKSKWSEPFWEVAENLTENHFVIVANQQDDVQVDITEDEAYLFGYYLAEGYLDKTIRKRDGKPMYRIFFCMHEKEKQHFADVVKKIKYKGRFLNKKSISFHFDENYEGKAIKAIISNERLYKLFETTHRGAMNKIVPPLILTAPKNIQKRFLEGYLYGDGSYLKNIHKHTAFAKNIQMAYGLRHLILRVYGELATIFFTKVNPTTTINGRVVNQHPYYSISWRYYKEKEVYSYKVKNNIVVKVVKNETSRTDEPVFNLAVRGDNTFTVGNYVVHNCQDFSICGRRAGLGGERSSLIEHAITLIAEYRPDIFVWENVKGVFSSNDGADFWAIIKEFTNIGGYRREWQLLNTNWVLPQNRERVYLVGHLADRSECGVFPFRESDFDNIEKGGKIHYNSRTITRRYSLSKGVGTFIKQINKSKEYQGQPRQQNRVYHEDGIMCCLPAQRTDSKINIYTGGNEKLNATNVRMLTEIECERLQGFPDDFTKWGDYDGQIKPLSQNERYMALGNSITVNLMELIAKRLRFN